MADLYGTTANDSIIGTSEADNIFAYEGNDSINTGGAVGGADQVYSGFGNDTVIGSDGNSTIYGEGGDKNILIGSGDHTVWLHNGYVEGDFYGNITVNAGPTGDNYISSDALGVHHIAVGGGNDTVHFVGMTGASTFSLGEGANLLLIGGGGGVTATAGAGNDTLTFDPSRAQGDNFSWNINAGGGDNVVSTANGSSTVVTGSGADTITTGNGDDSVNAGDGGAAISSGAGSDTILGGAAGANAFSIDVGIGNDVVSVGDGAATINGVNDDKNITLGSGDHTVWLHNGYKEGDFYGDITVNTGPTGDNYISSDALGVHHIAVGGGNDTVHFVGMTGDSTFSLGEGANLLLIGGGGDVTATAGAGDDTLTFDTSRAQGDNFSWNINAGGGDNVVSTANGSSTVVTGSGADTITTGKGDDSVNAGDGGAVISSGAGSDTILGGSAGANAFSIDVGVGNDVVSIGDGAATINGVNDDKNITLGSGNHTVWLHNGYVEGDFYGDITVNTGPTGDNYISSDALGVHHIAVGGGNDTVHFVGMTGDSTFSLGEGANLLLIGGGGGVTATAGAGNDTLTFDPSRAQGDNFSWNVKAGGGDNVVSTANGSSTVSTGNGADIITTGAGNDSVNAGGAAGGLSDYVNLGTGSDTLVSGNGNLTVDSGVGDKVITLAWGDHTINHSGPGALTINAGANGKNIVNAADDVDAHHMSFGGGADTVTVGGVSAGNFGYFWLGAGDDVLNVGVGSGTIWGSDGNDNITAGDGGAWSINGGADKDTILSGNGSDSLLGGPGDDSITASAGADTVAGVQGNDIVNLQDGSGGDLYVMHYDSTVGATNNDTISLDRGDKISFASALYSVKTATDMGDGILIQFTGVTNHSIRVYGDVHTLADIL